jgi:hypothetical protein
MNDMRLKVAGALMAVVLSLLGGGRATATPPQTSSQVRYACTPAQNFVVERSAGRAIVQFTNRSYDLKRKRSSIGKKYASETATLIVDGISAVFVAEDRLQLGTCVEALALPLRNDARVPSMMEL